LVSDLNSGRLCLVSSGGIETGKDILERLKMGADLVQVYTAFIYEGPAVLTRLKQELLHEMSRSGIRTLASLRR
ncbi:alpha-hydroxy-acid oxidizing protein, partial [Bombella apis]|uniref:alpha-hydroxy-acid oxidizing protein n=1 Tax=Bombella apis TaxID=1785988 RepID=UPI0023F9C2CD